jgi:hypothetical protein
VYVYGSVAYWVVSELRVSSIFILYRVGFGDICPGKMTLWGRVFLVCLLLMGLGIFGAVLEVFATWRHHIPGGYITMLSFVIGMGAAVFIALEGYSESEAIYASIITSKICDVRLTANADFPACLQITDGFTNTRLVHRHNNRLRR